MNYLSLGFPDKHFVLAPFWAADKGLVCNHYAYNSNDPLVQPSVLDFLSPIYRPLPYMNYIVQAVINALGYTFTENALVEDSRFQNLIIVHGYITYEYSKMLPDWTVNDFLNNIEKQFNATFVVNEKTKNVDLMLNSDVFSSENFQDLTVVDLFEMEVNDKNTISLTINASQTNFITSTSVVCSNQAILECCFSSVFGFLSNGRFLKLLIQVIQLLFP
jgi:hypothetical protein